MGCFSWLCAKTGKPILGRINNDWWSQEFSRVVLLTRTGLIRGYYDGYGRIVTDDFGEIDLTDMISVRLVLARYYDGEAFDAIARDSEGDPRQGYFYDEKELVDLFGQPEGVGESRN